MSEQLQHREQSGESHKPPEHSNEHIKQHHEREASHAEKQQHGNKEQLEHIQRTIEQQAVSGKEHSAGEQRQNSHQHPVLINKQLKDMAFHRAMTRTRKRLGPVSRKFSKVVHSTAIDKPSEFIGKTLARPQGMLWGAVFAFIGSSLLLWITRHYGYEYNYLAAILLFVTGTVIGTALEFIIRAVRKR